MIIIRQLNSFVLKLEKEDWFLHSTYCLLKTLKSIPYSYRRYDPAEKVWIVSNHYKKILESVQVYSADEDREGFADFNAFLKRFE